MAKRQQDTQLTKDDDDEDNRGYEGGPDRTVDPVQLASGEVMQKRNIKQPKSRFSTAGANTPCPSVPQPSFAFENNGVSTTPATPAPTANGSSIALFGATPATPTPLTPFAGFPTLNGGTPATPAQKSPFKTANPFASLSSTTPAGKPPAGLFGSTTPAGMPSAPTGMRLFGGSTVKFSAPEEKKDEASETTKPKPTVAGVSEFNFSTPAAKKDEGEMPKLTFTGMSNFNFPGSAAKNDDTAKPKPTFAGVSDFYFPPAPKNANDAGKPEPTFGGVPASKIFARMDDAQKKDAEEKPGNSFAGVFGSGAATAPATTPAKAPVESNTATPVGLFGKVASTASAGLFGSDAKIGDTKKVDGGLFGSNSSGSSAGLFGAKASSSLNAPSNASEVNYPALPPASTPSATATAPTTNGNTASIQFVAHVPPPPENLTEAEKEDFDRKYKIRILNATFVRSLVDAQDEDLRPVFWEYEQEYEQIMRGTKRKDDSQPNGNGFSPKRSKPDESIPGASSAASLFGAIVDKNIGPPANENQPKPAFGGSKPQTNATATPEKPVFASSMFGNTFTTPGADVTNSSSTGPTPLKATSNLFGSGGGAAVSASAPASGGGLFSNLKPILRDEKDLGEDDSPEKPKSEGVLFGQKPTESIAPPPVFSFTPGGTSTTEKTPSSNLFGTLKTGAAGDQTWKPDSPIKFGGNPSSGIFGSQSSQTTSGSNLFQFSSQGTAASTATAASEAPKPAFSRSSNTSLAPPPISRSVSFDAPPGSGISTPGALSDSSAPGSTISNNNHNEPSDDVRADKTDMSGPGPGEENDEVLYSVRVAVYIKDEKGAMKKVAVGASRVLRDKTSGKTRFLVRTEQGKVALNVRLLKEVHYTPVPEKKVLLVPDFPAGKPKVYTVRMKESKAVEEIGKVIADVKG